MSNSDTVRHRAPIPVERCGAARTVDLLADRWMLLIVREAFWGVIRYADIRADIGIPRSVLSERLKRLVASGILKRKPYREAGARARQGYALTPKGRDLGLVMLALMQWGDAHIEGHMPALEVTSRKSGKRLRVALVEEDAERVAAEDVVMHPLVGPDGPGRRG